MGGGRFPRLRILNAAKFEKTLNILRTTAPNCSDSFPKAMNSRIMWHINVTPQASFEPVILPSCAVCPTTKAVNGSSQLMRQTQPHPIVQKMTRSRHGLGFARGIFAIARNPEKCLQSADDRAIRGSLAQYRR